MRTVENFKYLPILAYKWNPDWFPIWCNLKNLKKKGVKVRFHNFLNLNMNKLSDNIAIDNRIKGNFITALGKSNIDKQNILLLFINKLKKKSKSLIYFDNKSSTGIQTEILPYIDKYLKGKLYKDRSLYEKRTFLGNRIFTDFYAKNYNIKEDNIYNLSKENDPEEKSKNQLAYQLYMDNKHKLDISWNIGLSDYRTSYKIPRHKNVFSKKVKLTYIKPNNDRKFDLAANFNYKFASNIIGFQRKEFLRILIEKMKDYKNISIGKIPKYIYRKTMAQSLAVLSPFGEGAICYRDFETFIYGAALIKPNMDHLDTWPNLYKKQETYIPLSWKIEDWENEITEILADKDFLKEIAEKGQNAYKSIWTKEGQEKFCDRFIELITFDK